VSAIRNVIVLGFILMAGFGATATYGGDFFTDQGSIWAGGAFTYLNVNTRGEKNPAILVMLSPIVRFFPVEFFNVSPAFSWEVMSSKSNDGSSYSSGSFTIGPELGFAFGKNIPVVPYVISGVKYLHGYYSSSNPPGTGFTQTSNGGADGYSIPIFAGIMVPLVQGMGIQVESGFTYNHSRDYTTRQLSDMSTFEISVGVCGVGRRTAVSFLNTISTLF
jgi:hypothetical protein